jgi:hypothetical protein
MKINLAITAACALVLAIGGTALAQCSKVGGGCGSCDQGGPLTQVNPVGSVAVAPDPYRQYIQKTLNLRQEMMNRRFELQRENLKATPDAARIAGIKSDIAAVQVKINQIRIQSGLPDEGKRDGECFKADGGCGMQNGVGGCNGLPCGQK